MPYTASQLTTFYTNANMGMTPSAAETLLIQAYAQQNTNGALTDAQTLNDVLSLSRDKTDVAVSTYEFFTGSTPTLAGLSYLVHGGGNANDLSSAYYANFNTENRYYNFAINLAFGGPNAASFASTYSNMTFDQAVASAYELIIGSANATAAGIDPAKAIASIEASLPYFQTVASERASGANQDLATKAIMIGYILEEAIKADVGTYAKGVDGFMTSLSTTGTATTGDLLTNYPATATQSFALTTGVDNIVGTSGNDTITGTLGGAAPTFTNLDKIDGGAGNDTLAINDLAGGTALPTGITVTGVENVVAQSAGALNMNFSTGFTGLTSVTATGATTANVTVGAGTAANVTSLTGAATVTGVDSAITVNSATSATVTGGSSQTVTAAGAVSVSGATGAISVTDAAQGANGITVNGGTDVTITTTDKATGGIFVGTTTGPTGNVTITQNLTAKGGNLGGGAITVNGGAVDTVTINASMDAAGTKAGDTVTIGNVTINGSTSTTAVTVNQTAAAAATAASAGTAGVTETGTVVFSGLANGATATVGGLTFTNTSGAAMTAAQEAAAFANLSTGATAGSSTLGTYSGSFTAAFSSGAASGTGSTTVVFTSSTPNSNVADLTVAGASAALTEKQGSAATAAVTGVAGVVDGGVTVTDASYGTATANTITTVSLSAYNGATISSDALTTLSLGNADDQAVVVNDHTATTLNLSLNNVTDSAGTQSSTLNLDGAAATYTTLNIASGAAASALAVTANAVTALTVGGASAVDMTGSALGALADVTVTGAAGLTINASGATVKDVNASGTSGDMTVTLDASKATYEGGSGTDALTLSATTVSKAISLGDGNDTITFATGTTAPTATVDGGTGTDTVALAQADAATLSASSAFATKVVNFEHLTLTGAGGGTVDLSALGHYGYVTISGDDSGVILNNMVDGGTVVLGAAANGAGGLTVNVPNATLAANTTDSLNVSLSHAGAMSGGTLTAAGVETINISANDITAKPVPVPGATADSLTVTDTSLTSVTITGNAHLALTATGDTALTSVDASGMSGGITFTTAGTTAETVHGGAASNTLTAGAGTTADVLVGGGSADVLTANAGLDVLTGGAGNDTFVVQTASSSIGIYSTITDFSAGDQLKMVALGTDTFDASKITLASTAVFQDYANAAIAATGNASANGALAWFQYGGDTYVVENLHDGVTTPSFQNGTDIVVKLTGLIDLSHAGFNSAGILTGH